MKSLGIILVVIVIMSCSKETANSENCNPENPFEMEWIQEWISELQFCTCTISIFQASYNGETVFWQLMNDPLCQSVIQNVIVVNCLGNELFVLENYQSWADFNKNVSDRKIIYACLKK